MKRLILIRHAHRDKTDRDADNGLSSKGRAQAAALLKYFQKAHGGRQPLILSSPKQRCMQTVAAIAHIEGVELQESKELLEQAKGEAEPEFRVRIERFLNWWEKDAPALTVICSHGDWLPLALEISTGARAEMKKGGLAEIKIERGRIWLTSLIPSFKKS